MQMGGPLTGKAEVTPQEFAAALESGVKGVQARGKAELEDKTMLDALLPAVDAISSSLATGANLQEALERAAEAAAKGMEATTPMVAKKGRASYLGERSAGHQDPGATSSYLLLKAASDTLSKVA
jgi:dihydroxyacetone kinase-like protein